MRYLNYYKIGIFLLFFTTVIIACKDYGIFLETIEINKISDTAVNTFSSKKNLSYSPTIKKLEQYEGVSIVKVESSKENQDLTSVQIEYSGNLNRGREIFNTLSKEPSIKAIKNICISDFQNNTIIKAKIDYLSNIICK